MTGIRAVTARRSYFATRLAIGLLVALAMVCGFVPARVTLALFTSTVSVTGNTFTTGTWVTKTYYLHNNPTPPTGNTASQFYLAMDSTVPTGGTLYNYDTNCSAASPGRDLQVTALGIYETADCKVTNWVAATRTTPLAISGAVQVVVWTATANFVSGTTGNISVALADNNPSAGTVSLITSASLTQANWQGGSGSWVQKTITLPSITYTVAVGHQLEVRLVAASGAAQTMWVAHDTSAYKSYLLLP